MTDLLRPIGWGLLMTTLAAGFLMGCISARHESFYSLRDPSGLILVGEAADRGDCLRVSPCSRFTQGGVWHPERWDITRGLEIDFQFQISEFGEWPPGYYYDTASDGLALVIQDDSPSALGNGGGGLGYDGLARCVAVEFDMWPNDQEGDPDGNHISIQSACDQPNSFHHRFSRAWTSDIPELSDGAVHNVRIVYEPGSLAVFLDGAQAPTLEVDIDLAACIDSEDGRAWVGFTAASGYFQQAHDIVNWSIRSE